MPEQDRSAAISKVLAMNYRSIGQQVMEDFVRYVHDITENQLEEFLRKHL